MKRVIKLSFVLFAMLGVLFTSCKKDYPEPPIQVLPIGTVYSIDSILKMESGTRFNEDASVYGIVTADEQSGNLYKAAFIQDRATGAAVELYLNATSGLRIGDSIRVYLKDVTYTEYNGLPQLSDFEADGHIVILANNKPIEPEETTIADIVAGNHLAGLVKLNNVMFTEKNTFAEPNTYGNRTLVDPTDFSQSVIVRTSNYANFAKDSLPQGTGNLTCIASLYGSTWQLLIRSAKELEFDGYTPGGGSGLPYYQDFASSFGTYSTYDLMGSQSWEIDYNTAKMTGYIGGNNYPNEDWLISAPVSFEGVSEVTMTMKYIARYFSNLNNDITIQVSTDYLTGDPNDANWTQVPATLSEGSNWTDFLTANIDLSQFAGQEKVVVAVKYVSDDVKAGTIEIQSILIQEGGGINPPPGPTPGGEVQSLPYTQLFATEFGTYITKDLLGAQSWSIDYKTAKMTGHEGGNPGENYANDDWLISSPVAITGVDDAKMTMSYIGRYFTNISDEVTIWVSTDYTFGDDPTNATWNQVPATLKEGSNWNDFLTAEISLSQYVGQTVYVAVRYTSTDTKAGTIEIQSITIEEGTGVGPTPPPQPGGEVQNLPYSQSFMTDFGSYTTHDALGPESWMIDYKTAKMTGYVSQTVSHANEDWLISSPVAITGVNDAKMTMVYIGRYFDNKINEDVTIWASMDYVFGNDPTTATWTHVPATLTEGTNWTNFTTTEIPLTDYVGQTVSFAVKYVSRDSRDSYAGTIEIQSITIEEGTGVGPTPPPTPGPGTGSGTQDDPYNVASGIGLQGQNIVGWVQGYIVGAVKPDNSSVSSNDQIDWNAPFNLNTNVLIADDPDCQDVALCVIVNLPNNKPLRTQVNLVDHPENLGKLLTVNGKLRTYFGQAGLRDSGGTENDFVLEGGSPTPPPTPQGIYSETFANGQGDFVIKDVELAGMNYVWAYMNNFQCMKANGYYQTAHATESWLVSPQIDLSDVTAATLSFDHAVAFASAEGALYVMISTDYSGDVTTANWTELNIGTWPEPNSSWVFETSTADLTNFVGQHVTIAFKYTSTENLCPAWEVKNFVVE